MLDHPKSHHQWANRARFLFALQRFALLFLITCSYPPIAGAKPTRLELASGFHHADPLFGQQLSALIARLKSAKIDKVRLRQSRKAMGASSTQMIDLMRVGSIDGALIDPVKLGYRPAIAQLLGGIPFGPTASKVLDWTLSSAGRGQLVSGFQAIGVYPLVCGHSDSYSGVFARRSFVWPADTHRSTVHARGMGQDIYQGLGFITRQLPGADLYMGYATGVADYLVSLNPSMDARAGFAQVSDYFFYPSWERSSAFAVLLVSLKPWQSFSDDARASIAMACEDLNSKPVQNPIDSTLADIQQQGSSGTTIQPWPATYRADAQAQWRKSAANLVKEHPTLEPAFWALGIPSEAR